MRDAATLGTMRWLGLGGVKARFSGVVLAVAALGAAACACREPVTPEGRPRLNCDSEISYTGVKVSGGVTVLDIAGAKSEVETKSIREASERLQSYIAVQRRTCDEYNKGAITREQYQEKANLVMRLLFGVASDRAKNGQSEEEKASAGKILADLQPRIGATALALTVSLRARIPTGPGELAPEIVAPPNYPLPTGTLGAFEVSATETAHLYMFQVTAKNEVNVLFPNPKLETANPLVGGKKVRMPGVGADGKLKAFRLDDQGIGLERVFFVLSKRPLPALDRSLAAFAAGKATALDSDPALADFGALKPGAEGLCEAGGKTRDLGIVDDPQAGQAKAPRATGECVRTRGWVLDDAPEPGKAVDHSLAVRAAPGEDIIVKFYQFQHVPEADFKAKLDAYNARTPDGAKQRGISIEN